MFNLRKVDFIWINRDQRSFEWFVNLLSQLEADQQEHGGELGRFLEMHMYVTSALQRNDVKEKDGYYYMDRQEVYEKHVQKEGEKLANRVKGGGNGELTKLKKEYARLKEHNEELEEDIDALTLDFNDLKRDFIYILKQP